MLNEIITRFLGYINERGKLNSIAYHNELDSLQWEIEAVYTE